MIPSSNSRRSAFIYAEINADSSRRHTEAIRSCLGDCFDGRCIFEHFHSSSTPLHSTLETCRIYHPLPCLLRSFGGKFQSVLTRIWRLQSRPVEFPQHPAADFYLFKEASSMPLSVSQSVKVQPNGSSRSIARSYVTILSTSNIN